MRTPIIGGNFKCNGSVSFIDSHLKFLSGEAYPAGVDIFVAPAMPYLYQARQLLPREGRIILAAQNCYLKPSGAWTGETSTEILRDMGVNTVIVGHSERRRIMKETNEESAAKAAKALAEGMQVVFCIGETLDERNAGKCMDVNIAQLEALRAVLANPEAWKGVVIAYEPVWSIGTGVVASPEQAQEVHSGIRRWLAEQVSDDVAKEMRIMYGGSANLKNCRALAACEDIDGFLVGGASLKPEFAEMVKALAEVKNQANH